ncbi:hypothetical protein JY651_22560 [Pyxidicoccus parkwayensis]|uniref:Lipoprotein n=1 Tax=Pyxidicoccus parkwayensis TaxID=2813578 RepID=A0ABX7PAM9_9BACT|nr:hypothetical protein [Pyxidicoccus parkwaysis]QSQ27524.1 hypothetical protein JY651_22560 [Pyxidicoccus parkwaysis]
MNRGLRAVVTSLCLALLLSAPMARADGLGTIPYGDNCWGSGTDADKDGLNDDCEYQVALAFMPKLWFDTGESGYGRRPYYAVKSESFATRTLRIFYLDTFFDDTGVTTGHDGDPEFQLFEVHYSGGRWYLDWVYLSAHRKSVCDSSAWYAYDQLEYDTSDSRNGYRGWPTLYVAEDKHATYNNLSTCDSGCFAQDYCSKYASQFLDTSSQLVSRNVGSTTVPLINQVVLNGKTERLLDDVEFKGWDDQWYRPNSEGYRRHLVDFGF